jgi:hypothetical protein
VRERARRRRQRTRGLLVLSVLLVALVLAGTDALMRARPVVDTSDLIVTGLPPRAAGANEPRSCLRGVDDAAVREIREELLIGRRISSAQVTACPQAFDQLDVRFAGEVIGDLLRRDGGVWVQVNDDDYALEVGPLSRHDDRRGFNGGLAVWLPDGLHEQVSGLGGPHRRGDVLLIDGVILRADPEDGGGTTLRARSAQVLAPSVELPTPLHVPQAVVAALLGPLAVAALVWSRSTRRR